MIFVFAGRIRSQRIFPVLQAVGMGRSAILKRGIRDIIAVIDLYNRSVVYHFLANPLI